MLNLIIKCAICGKPLGKFIGEDFYFKWGDKILYGLLHPEITVYCLDCWKEETNQVIIGEFVTNRLRALERDNHKCRCCGRLAEKVHNINSDISNNKMENLESLCVSCHGRYPRIRYHSVRNIKSQKKTTDPEGMRDYMREYMREYRRKALANHTAIST